MAADHYQSDTLAGTLGGTFLSLIPNLDTVDFLSTMVLAAVGAMTSFLVTQLLRWMMRKREK
jgi:hypothetical protein